MKKTLFILTLMLAWIGVPNATAQLTNASNLSALISSTTATSMETGKYYVLQNRSTSKYLVDNDGVIGTNATAPMNGDADADGVYEYLFTRTAAGYIQSADGTNVPQLTSGTIITDATVEQGGQLVARKALSAGVFTVNTGTGSGYVSLCCNDLFLNCDLNGASTKGEYSDWKLVPVNFVNRGESTICNITYVYKNGTTEWYRETYEVNIGDAYPDLYSQPTGVKYNTVPSGTVSGSETFVVECELTNKGAINSIVSSTYASATWVFLGMGGSNYHMKYTSAGSYITLDSSKTVRPTDNSTNYGYQWAFVGNPFTGYKIYNRSAGSNYILASTTPSGNGTSTYPTMQRESSLNTTNYNTTWDCNPSGFGFVISRHGESVNLNNAASAGKLAFWTSVDDGSRFSAEKVSLTLSATSAATSGKTYRLVNRYTGKALGLNADADAVASAEVTSGDNAQLWKLTTSGTGYTLQNVSTSNYLTNSNGSMAVNSTTGSTFYLISTGDGYYNIVYTTTTSAGTTERIAIADDGSTPKFYTTLRSNSQWQLVEATAAAATTYATSATSGKYYRIYNYSYGTVITESSGYTYCKDKVYEGGYNQIWKFTSKNGGFTIQNVFSNKYIASNSGWSSVHQVGTTGGTFTFTAVDGMTGVFTIKDGTLNGLHCDGSGNVVNWWDTTNEHNYWQLEEVSLSAADIAAMQELQQTVNNASSYTSTLSTYFLDAACTELRSNYASMTDAQLRNAMSSVPTVFQDMAVAVKNNTWVSEENAQYNNYVKNFRIADYEIYTNCNWNGVTGVGPFAMLYNPTGITVKNGDIIYLFADASAKDSKSELLCHIVSDTNRYPDQTVTLQKGVNAILATTTGEVFIDYTLNNVTNSAWTGEVCGNYPNIKVHIEGGKCEGMWDLHRGMTNNDWVWLKNNMFTNKILHVKGNSTLLNMVTESSETTNDPTRAIFAWDFVFDTQESLTGCDQWRKTGAYKPMINSRHSYGNNPNWDGGHGTNHPSLTYMFNIDNLYNTGTHGGTMWEIAHEIGHAHQYPFLLAGTTEQTNNSLACCVNLLWNQRDDVLTKRSDRQDGVKGLIERYNKYPYSWIDYAGQRDCGDGYSSLWIANKWFYQLWLYFDHLGNYQPEGGNTGFSFVSELCNKLRADGIRRSSSSSSPAKSTDDYLKLAKYACEVAQADLSEYFQVWGFFVTDPVNSADEDLTASKTWFVGDYGSYWIQTSATDAASYKTDMQKYDKKISNLVFIEGRGSKDDTWLTYDGSASTDFGETGWYKTFMDEVTKGYNFSISGTTVTMKDGEGAVGFKIYDASGNLVWLSNYNSFTVTSEIATALKNGTYTIVAASGDGTDYAMGEFKQETNYTISSVTSLVKKLIAGDASVTAASIQVIVDKILGRE